MTEDDSKPDPLAALIVDGEELDKELIVGALKEVAGLNKLGDVVQLHGFAQLTARQKVLAYLLAYKAAVSLQLRTDHTARTAELARSTGLAEGTVYPTMTQLRSDRAVSQDSNSRYFIADHQVANASAEVASGPNAPTQARTRKQRPSRSKPSQATHGGKASGTDGTDSTRKTSFSRNKPPSAGDFTPSDAVRSMIRDGFFETPKGLGDVRMHLKDVHARDVPVTTLSPLFTRLLRSGDLKRSKNAQGTYEYCVSRTA